MIQRSFKNACNNITKTSQAPRKLQAFSFSAKLTTFAYSKIDNEAFYWNYGSDTSNLMPESPRLWQGESDPEYVCSEFNPLFRNVRTKIGASA